MKKKLDLCTQNLLYYSVMRKGKNKEMNEMTELTFENVPEMTYWRNPKTGTILTLGIFRNNGYENNPNHLSMSTSNTRNELTYWYTWDEIVEKFEYLGECNDNDYYLNVLANKTLYWRYRQAKKGLPSRLRYIKNGGDSNMTRESVEEYTTWINDFESKFN